jgi:outer membrane lipoprotein-sorting protein
MKLFRGTRECTVVALLLVGSAAFALSAAAQSTQSGEAFAPPSQPVDPAQPSASGDKLFAEVVKHNEQRTAALRQYSASRIYAVTDISGKVHAKETVRMEYVAPDKKTFVMTGQEGSSLVRRLVLNRLMESEVDAAAGKEHHDSSITPANYVFQLAGQEDMDGHHCFVVDATPKRRDKYLFEGKVWIDSTDFAIVRIAGHPAKNLSFWVARADFVRQYEKIGDFWLPAKDETTVEVKLYGKKILSIEHHTDSVNGVTNTVSNAPRPPAVDVSEKTQ